MRKAKYKRLCHILIIVILFNLVIPILTYPKKAYAAGAVVYNEAEKRFEYNIDVKARTTNNYYNTTGFTLEYNGVDEIFFGDENYGWKMKEDTRGDTKHVEFWYYETAVREALKSRFPDIDFSTPKTIYFNAILYIHNDGKEKHCTTQDEAIAFVSSPNLDWGSRLKNDIRKHYRIRATLPAERRDTLRVNDKGTFPLSYTRYFRNIGVKGDDFFDPFLCSGYV